MLVVTRKVGERIVIGDNVTVTVVRIAGGLVRIGVEAPTDYLIVRKELKSENGTINKLPNNESSIEEPPLSTNQNNDLSK